MKIAEGGCIFIRLLIKPLRDKRGDLGHAMFLTTLLISLMIVTPIVLILKFVFNWDFDFTYRVWILSVFIEQIVLMFLWR